MMYLQCILNTLSRVHLKCNGRVSWMAQLQPQAKLHEDAVAPVCRQTMAKWHMAKQPLTSQLCGHLAVASHK